MEPCEGGGYKDNQTGEMLSWLSQKDEAFFMTSMQRLCDRHRGGKWQTDWCKSSTATRRKPCICDSLPEPSPDYAEENVETWKLRKRIRANQKTERRTARRKRADASQEPDNKAKRQAVGGAEIRNMEGERPAVHETRKGSASEDTPPDWGDDDNSPEAHYTRTRGRTVVRSKGEAIGQRWRHWTDAGETQ